MRFALIGAAGYIAPRHLQAIKDIGGELVAATDPHYGVGILDRYFHDCEFFLDYERFENYLYQLKVLGKGVDFVSIASPNHLHASHIMSALRLGANVICEKPLVLDEKDIDLVKKAENETGKKVYTILQLRLHPKLIELKNKIDEQKSLSGAKKRNVNIKYMTPRGKWYFESWKGDDSKSGGVATNIGIHFFDLMMWLFGEHIDSQVHHNDDYSMNGIINLENANVNFHLSIDPNDAEKTHGKKAPYRSITIDNDELEFSDVFTDLHTESYKQIIEGNGFGIDDAELSIRLVSELRRKSKE
jgi:UDP-N-acetyl-2-amino-2-deoxyglucuronate dehydrogenase